MASPATADIDAVLLDLDDTLVSTRAAMQAAGAAAIRELWPTVGEAAVVDGGERYRADPQGHFAAYTRGEADFGGMRAARVRDLAEWLGVEGEVEDVLPAFVEAYEPAFGAALRAFDDVLPTLRTFADGGLRLGILTNSSRDYTELKLESTGLAGLVGVVVTRDALGFGKPDPRVFAHACDLLGVAPGRTAYVGDEFAVDALGAANAGLRAAWIRRPGYPVAEADRREAAAHGIRLIDGLARLLPTVTGECCPPTDLGSPPADR